MPFGQDEAEIAGGRVGGDALLALAVLLRRAHGQQLPVRLGDVGDGLGQLLLQVCPLQRQAGGLRLIAVHILPEGHSSQHHLRVLEEVAVQGYAVLGLAGLNPLRHLLRRAGPFLEKEDVRGDFRAGVGLEGVIGQADCAQQVGLLGQILAYLAVLLVHGALGSDKGHHAARAHLVQRLGDEVVVDEQVLTVIAPVMDLVLAKGHVAHGKVKEIVRVIGVLKAVHGDVRFLIELLGNPPGEGIQLHAVELRTLHPLRQKAEEVADAAGGL